MVLPSDERIVPAMLQVLNGFFRARVPGYVDVTELPEDMPEGFPWKDVAKALGMEGKNAHRALRQRYMQNLRPGLITGPWQTHEDDLIYLEKAKGKGWTAISALLKGRNAKTIAHR